MASDQESKSEAPTPRRLERAWEEGQIGFSGDFVAGLVLIVGVLFFWLYGRQLLDQLKLLIRYRLTYFQAAVEDPAALPAIMLESFLGLTAIVLGLLVPLCAASLLGGGLQTRFNVSFKPLEFKWDRLSPAAGFRKIFSLRSVVRGVSALLKTALVAGITYALIQSRIPEVALAGFLSLDGAFQRGTSLFLSVAIAISLALLLLGLADLGFEKWRHLRELRMSLQEIKDERKEDEGDPLVKARIRRLQSELTRQAIAREVPKATVVVTNPTHFAVALKFDRQSMGAPLVVAKGSDHLAKQIIEIARTHGVAVVERKPVARFLFFNVKVGKPIPVELYLAVAEIINFVNRSRRAA